MIMFSSSQMIRAKVKWGVIIQPDDNVDVITLPDNNINVILWPDDNNAVNLGVIFWPVDNFNVIFWLDDYIDAITKTAEAEYLTFLFVHG
jgi:hypothetical protein